MTKGRDRKKRTRETAKAEGKTYQQKLDQERKAGVLQPSREGKQAPPFSSPRFPKRLSQQEGERSPSGRR